ncbi:hypothetical protein TWF192_005749 [Orbilia oligospora]|uniref:Protein kinase domain-containing protein n=1 Tax=Orbilia oligospora TaxID=2813651 RepID=A0A6G1MLJ7_ORBOL|nr:hypothetical protein TWF191_003891 [Orbilia oligospora]KAF3263468.1 hypothetical protein TWF192_005749 [Orbilia oligospora]
MLGNTWPTQGDPSPQTSAPRAPIAPQPALLSQTPHKTRAERSAGGGELKRPTNTGKSPISRGSMPKAAILKPATAQSMKVTKQKRFPVRLAHQHQKEDTPMLETVYETDTGTPVPTLPKHKSSEEGPVRTSRWSENLPVTLGGLSVLLCRGPKLFYIMKAGKEYVHYYDRKQPTKVYLVAHVSPHEVDFLQKCSNSPQIIDLLGYDTISHGIFDISKSQDLCQIYGFALTSLKENVIWYIASEVLKAIVFLHDQDIVLNTLKCEWILVNVKAEQCRVQIANTKNFSNVTDNKEFRKLRDTRQFGNLVYELIHRIPFDGGKELRRGDISPQLQEFASSTMSRENNFSASRLQAFWKNFLLYTDQAVVHLISLVDGAALDCFQEHGDINENRYD